MPDAVEHSDVRRALIEKYLQKKRLQPTKDAGTVSERLQKTENVEPRARVTPIQAGGAKRPFFFLHGHWLGTAFYCYPLAASLGADQPFYALEPYSFDGLPIPPKIENIAAAHIKVMQAIQPDGPYLIGGFCNGALVAYEMALQLDAQEQKVDLLALLDPMAMGHTLPVYQRFLRRLTNLLRDPHKQLDWFVRLRHILRESYNYLRSLLPWWSGDVEVDWDPDTGNGDDKAQPTRPRIAAIIPSHEAIHWDYVAMVEWAVLDYRPRGVYPGKITFLWPQETLEHVKWWDQVTKAAKIEEHFVPGTQVSWKSKHIRELSECLQGCFSTTADVKIRKKE
ncbi:MAG: hypothetical protein JOZ18_07055 [Chloroflexi bacterium]|nr:hypothetical protein [Chloroflexota bacterium]